MSRSYPIAGSSVFRRQFSVLKESGPSWSATRHTPRAARHFVAAFTLIELLIVIALIAILAGLTLATMGYVNKKGAESRARSEVAALSAAIDSYKLEFGSYPASNDLVTELTARGPVNTNRVFFEPTGSILTNNRFVDPWGSPYNYTTNPSNNIGLFDLWTSNNASANPALWIRN